MLKRRRFLNLKACFGIFIIFLSCAPVTKVYQSGNESVGFENLYINSDYTYSYSWQRYFDVGPINDTIKHEGVWRKLGDTIILNTNVEFIPTKYQNFKYVEESRNDSMKTKLIFTSNGPSLFFLLHSYIRIDEVCFDLFKPVKDTLIFNTARKSIEYIIIPGYPIYYVKNQNSNIFNITLFELEGNKYLYPENTYFKEERFIISKDTLIRINCSSKNREIYIEK